MQKIFIVSPVEARYKTQQAIRQTFSHSTVIFQTDECTFDVTAVEEDEQGNRKELPELRIDVLSELFPILYADKY